MVYTVDEKKQTHNSTGPICILGLWPQGKAHYSWLQVDRETFQRFEVGQKVVIGVELSPLTTDVTE